MPAIQDPSRVAEILRRKGRDPYEEMMNIVTETIPVIDGADPKLIIPMMDRYDLAKDDKGNNCLRLKAMHRFEIWKEMAQYVYPKLRSSETKDEKDYKLTVVLKNLNGTTSEIPNRTDTVIDIQPVIQKITEQSE
jgi:hypothetical protein